MILGMKMMRTKEMRKRRKMRNLKEIKSKTRE
jgi:hypothetical protein